MKHAVILVVYQKSLADSAAGSVLPEVVPKNSVVCVYDNSEADFGNRDFCDQFGWIYLTEGKNKGLSVAYQTCVDYLSASGFSGWITIFDDDTGICKNYFSALRSAIAEKAECSLFFPILYADTALISPQIIPSNQHARFFASKQNCFDYTGKDLFAFNSGMAVHSDVYRQVRYDERLFLDGVDYSFLKECRKSGFLSAPFDAEMQHGFSGMQRQTYNAARGRFEHYARDHSIVLQDNFGGYFYLIGKRALHLALVYKKCIFLSIFWKYRPKVARYHET